MTSIKSIKLVRFKRFSQFMISCRETNILVGPNNAGKSTALDALRITRDVMRYGYRYRARLGEYAPYGVARFYEFPNSFLSIPTANIVRDYGEEPAEIIVNFSNGNSLHVILHPERPVRTYVTSDSPPSTEVSAFKRMFPLELVVVPTLSSLEGEEKYLSDETVSRNENTRLASRNFRNIVYRQDDDTFRRFRDICELGWDNVVIQKPRREGYGQNAPLVMFFEEHRKPREVYWAGFGFQVWMQISLQLLRAKHNAVLVLDEPDIYLHPDLQRKLLRLAKNAFSQLFLATHSTEIINESDAGDVLYVDSEKSRSFRVNDDDAFRKVYSLLGSSENAEFSRLARAKQIIFFEGKDRKIIKKFAKIIGNGNILEDPQTQFLQAGGFGQWQRVKEIAWALENIFKLNIRVGAIFDGDFRCDEENDEFIQNINNENIIVSVLKRKEIENYALSEKSISKAILARGNNRGIKIEENDAKEAIRIVLDDFKDEIKAQRDSCYTRFHAKRDPRIDMSQHLRNATRIFNENWKTVDARLRIVPGKDFLTAINVYLNENYKFNITINGIIDQIEPDKIDSDLKEILARIDGFFNAAR